MEFDTIINNGCIEQFKNTCMWISIWQFIRYVLRNSHITVAQIRNDADFTNPKCSDDMEFNIDIPEHKESLIKFLKKHDLAMHVYYANRIKESDDVTSKWLGTVALVLGTAHIDGLNVIPVVSYGSHFELIVSGTDTTLPLELDQVLIRQDNIRIRKYTPKIQINNKYIDINIQEQIDKLCKELTDMGNELKSIQIHSNEINEHLHQKQKIVDVIGSQQNFGSNELLQMEKELGSLNDLGKSLEMIKASGEDIGDQQEQLSQNVFKLLDAMSKLKHNSGGFRQQKTDVHHEIEELNNELLKCQVFIKSKQLEIQEKEKLVNSLLENENNYKKV